MAPTLAFLFSMVNVLGHNISRIAVFNVLWLSKQKNAVFFSEAEKQRSREAVFVSFARKELILGEICASLEVLEIDRDG